MNVMLAIAQPQAAPALVPAVVGTLEAAQDARWPLLLAELVRLRRAGRHAVRILDLDCGQGSVLLAAIHVARLLGFTAIEGRGVDGSPGLVGRARDAARQVTSPAVGVAFETADVRSCLAEEAEMPADILLWHGSRAADLPLAVADLLSAGEYVIGDEGAQRTVST